MGADCFLTAIVTGVVLIAVFVLTLIDAATIVTSMILVLILVALGRQIEEGIINQILLRFLIRTGIISISAIRARNQDIALFFTEGEYLQIAVSVLAIGVSAVIVGVHGVIASYTILGYIVDECTAGDSQACAIRSVSHAGDIAAGDLSLGCTAFVSKHTIDCTAAYLYGAAGSCNKAGTLRRADLTAGDIDRAAVSICRTESGIFTSGLNNAAGNIHGCTVLRSNCRGVCTLNCAARNIHGCARSGNGYLIRPASADLAGLDVDHAVILSKCSHIRGTAGNQGSTVNIDRAAVGPQDRCVAVDLQLSTQSKHAACIHSEHIGNLGLDRYIALEFNRFAISDNDLLEQHNDVAVLGCCDCLTQRSKADIADSCLSSVIAVVTVGIITIRKSVSESRCCIGIIAVSAGRTGIGSVAVFGTGGRCYLYRILVAELRNSFLCNQNCITYRAVRAFRQTGFGTGRIFRCVDHFGVAKGIDYCLCYQNLATDGAVRAFRQAGFGTSRSLCSINHFSVAQSINNFLLYQNLAADGAMLAFGQTGFGTSRSLCSINLFSVAQSINNFLLYQNLATDGAFHARSKTGFRTGRGHCRDRLVGVSSGIHHKRCCSCGDRSCFIQEENATIITAALVMFLVSSFGAGGCLSLHMYGSMADRINVLGVSMGMIILTGEGLYALSCTGRIGGNYAFIPSVTGGSDRLSRNGGCIFAGLILEYAATSVTGVVCIVTGGGTGCILRFGQGRVVTKGIDLVISGMVTLSAILVCIPTDLGTGCSLGSYCCDIVAGFLDGFLCNGGFICAGFILEYLAASAAGVVFVIAGFCTGRCLSIGLGHLVAKCADGLGCNGSFICAGIILEYLTASAAGVVFVIAGGGTGRCLCFGLGHLMAKSIDCFLFNQNFAANGAFRSLGKTGFRTGCGYCRDGLMGATLGGDLRSCRLLCCPSNNKGCGVCSLTRFCAVSFLCYNGGYCCFCCFKMVAVSTRALTLSGAVSIAIGPFIGCFTIIMTQCGNIFYVLSPFGCPIDIKGCGVSSCSLLRTGCRSLNCVSYSCCCSLNMAAIIGAYTLGGADPNLVHSIVLPSIRCICKSMAKCLANGNGLVCTYRITTVTLYIVSCSFCTGSSGGQFTRRLRIETMPQLGVFFCKRFGSMDISASFTLGIVQSIFCTSSRFSQLFRKLCVTMTQSSHFVRHISVTTFAGVSGIALVGTGRCGYNASVLVFMRVCCNYDILGNIVNVDLDHRTAKLGILYHGNAGIGNIYAAIENLYLHDKRHIIQLQVCIECLTLYNDTCRTFHSGYACHIVVSNVYIIICVQRTGFANRSFKSICENFHALDIGMQPVFHQIFEVLFICFDTGVFDVNHVQIKVICHLNEIIIKISRLMNACSERKQGHHIDLRVLVSLLHLMEGDRIGLHGVFGFCISKCAVCILGDQCIKVYIFIASQHRLIIATILKLRISTIDQFCVLKVIGAHVNNDDIGFLTAVCSGIIMELNNTVLPHTGRAVLPEMNSTARPGVVYQDIGAQLISCLIDPDVLGLSNFALCSIDGISFGVVLFAYHGEPYTAASQRAVCSTSRCTV